MESTSSILKPFSTKDLKKTMEIIESLPPVAVELQVFIEGYDVIFHNVSKIDELRKEELLKTNRKPFFGIKLIVIAQDDKMKTNQGRVIYNDGSSKIISIY